MNRYLIVTADDYGMCAPVNQAIEECLAAGTLRATCVMTNMPAYGSLPQLRERFPEASVGLHWTLTQGCPVLSPAQVSSLVTTSGEFHSFTALRQRLLARRIDFSQVRTELLAQHRRFYAVGGPPAFWNTHEGVHVAPGLFKLFVQLGQELGIPAMRCHRRITIPRQSSALRYNLSHPLFWAKGRIIDRWAAQAEARGMRMPSGILHTPGLGRERDALEQIARRIPWGRLPRVVELVIHPATSIDAALFGTMTASRLREYETFRDPDLKDRLRQIGVEPAGFEVLSNGH